MAEQTDKPGQVKKNTSAKFNTRHFVSVLLAITFAVLFVSGLVLYIAPNNRIAQDTGWNLIGLSRQNWGALHIGFTLTFVAAAAFHIYWHWRSIRAYVERRVSGHRRITGEVMTATLISVTLIASALADFPPVSYVSDLHEYLRKEAWQDPSSSRPGARRQFNAGLEVTPQVMDNASNEENTNVGIASSGERHFTDYCGKCHSAPSLAESVATDEQKTETKKFLESHGKAPSEIDDAIIEYISEVTGAATAASPTTP